MQMQTQTKPAMALEPVGPPISMITLIAPVTFLLKPRIRPRMLLHQLFIPRTFLLQYHRRRVRLQLDIEGPADTVLSIFVMMIYAFYGFWGILSIIGTPWVGYDFMIFSQTYF